MRDPIREALETKDDAELGRLLRTDYASLLANLPIPGRLPEPPPSRAGGAGTYFDNDPPTPAEVAEAAAFKFGARI